MPAVLLVSRWASAMRWEGEGLRQKVRKRSSGGLNTQLEVGVCAASLAAGRLLTGHLMFCISRLRARRHQPGAIGLWSPEK